jgi:hypothetical protein
MEHQVAALSDGIRAALKRLGDAEEANTRRIADLERRLSAKVTDTVEGTMSDRLARLEAAVDAKVRDDVLPTLQATVEASSRGWLVPFIVMAAVLAVAMCINFRYIRWLVKRETGLDLGFGFSPTKKY